jgi:hypothetical protein
MRDRIIEMLGKGIPATQVASAVGCDDSYISQLLSQPGVIDKVTEMRAAHFSSYLAHDQKTDDLEAIALDRVATLIPFITRPAEAVRVYQVLNAAKRRTVDSASQAQAVAQTISLELPTASRVRFTLTQDRQVIEIEGRSMTTMPAKSIAAQLEQRNAARLLSADIPTKLMNASQQVITDVDPSERLSKKNTPLVSQL